jgi:galactokinase
MTVSPGTSPVCQDDEARVILEQLALNVGFSLRGARLRRSSSRFCLGVEHGDYNGTELFGVGTDRFIWMAYKPNDLGRLRLYSGNFQQDGLIDIPLGEIPEPGSAADAWSRFPFGVAWILNQRGHGLTRGMDAVLYGNIPGGGMSRSASLTLNLLISLAELNGICFSSQMEIVDLAQAVENHYIGSPCGNLDQIMILFAREGMGTHYNPADRSIHHVPLGEGFPDFRIMSLDTGTVRPGLEKSTYKIRHAECRELVELCREPFGIRALGDVRSPELFHAILDRFRGSHPRLCMRLDYIYHAQSRFDEMLRAWRAGDVAKVGAIFRADGLGLRDNYEISGKELETMCDIVRTVPGVLGERMLGGGDKGASGALVLSGSEEGVRSAVETSYPRSHPEYAGRFAVHSCRIVDGIKVLPGWE